MRLPDRDQSLAFLIIGRAATRRGAPVVEVVELVSRQHAAAHLVVIFECMSPAGAETIRK